MISYYFFNFFKKNFSKGFKENGGRNFLGRVCIRGRGNGIKKLYRFIDFYRRLNRFGIILKIFKDLNRSSKIALVLYMNGLSSYILLQKEVIKYDVIYSGTLYNKVIKKISNGYSLPIKYMPLFSTLSNIENKPFKGSILSRAANVSSLLMSKDKNMSFFKFNSRWNLKLSVDCIASLGAISNTYNKDLIIGKAGKNRGLGFKSKVRGVAKNPCDHPHGGGNGKKSKPLVAKNAWCTVFKWRHTKISKLDVLKRRLYKDLKN